MVCLHIFRKLKARMQSERRQRRTQCSRKSTQRYFFCCSDLTQHAVYCTRHNHVENENWLAHNYFSKTFPVSPSSPIIKSTITSHLAETSTLEPCAQSVRAKPAFRADPNQVAQNQAQKYAHPTAQTHPDGLRCSTRDVTAFNSCILAKFYTHSPSVPRDTEQHTHT